MFLVWLDSIVEWFKFLGSEWYYRIRWLILQGLTIVILFITLLWLAVFMYGSFYYAYIPPISHSKDNYFYFSSDCDPESALLCSFPSANFSLLDDGNRETLRRGQVYVVNFEMAVPESDMNQGLGMFMVQLVIYGKHGEVVQTSRRSALISYKSPLLHALETWSFLPALLFGYTKQEQKLSVDLFENYIEDPYKPAFGAYVEIQTRKIQIYRSKISLHARFTGLRYFMYHYPFISTFIGVTVNMFFLIVITLASWYRFGAEVSFEEPTPLPASSLSREERRNRAKAKALRDRPCESDKTTNCFDIANFFFLSQEKFSK
ncbi:hypothetical protein CAPTEDRAFT_127674 [Capitella teleta]|uniref:Seipin n=1 Tax=Capitella teleta TaxID=283909 RepID=R7TUG7_CAPTE|nr:hypothetical protein CAPTEDRAFT_127674 [Capitella teleta]|eukprot:ELT94670.1 hypothetical protein CAPTEDRAFT_127674 [Capitella teleta]